MTELETHDRRVRRTQLAVFAAFRELVLSRRYDEIRVADIIENADIGRSTFYDHFNSKDDVLLQSIDPLFRVLSEMVVKSGIEDDVTYVLAHFWEQRALGRIIFSTDLYFKLVRKLADMVEPSLGKRGGGSDGIKIPVRGQAIAFASEVLGSVKSWLSGEFTCAPAELSAYLVGRAQSFSSC